MLLRCSLGLVCALLLAACAGQPAITSASLAPNIELLDTDTLPEPSDGRDANGLRNYTIGAFDRLKVDVFDVPEISNAEIEVDAGGRISVPLAGDIQVAGRTPSEAADLIEAALLRYIRDPQVAVNLIRTVSQVVTVDGEVKRPGLYPVQGDMTLMRAVARAEGLTEFADTTDVVVFRTIGDQKYAALYNLNAVRRGAYEDPDVFPDDIVIVGKSARRQLFRDTISVVPAILSPLVVLLR